MLEMTAIDLLSAWDHAEGQAPLRGALALLSVAHPDRTAAELAALTIGERNLRLLELRARCFGEHVTAVATCPACGHAIELGFRISDVRGDPPVPEDAGAPRPQSIQITASGFRVECRLPTTDDLSSVEAVDDADRARVGLLRRCVLSIERERPGPDGDVGGDDPSTLPTAVVEALADGLSAADPQADTVLALSCPECGHGWQAPFDIASYLFAEVHTWARRVLQEVHELASAYGWSEADILAMAPARRVAYRQLLGLG